MKNPFWGIHAVAAAPWHAANPGAPFKLQPSEIYCMALQIERWKKQCGMIALVADLKAAEYLAEVGLAERYDAIKTLIWPTYVDPAVFWAWMKIMALEEFQAPCAIFDCDVVTNFPSGSELLLNEKAVCSAHESWNFGCYNSVMISCHYKDVYPTQTSFLSFTDDELRLRYINAANSIRAYTSYNINPVNHMVIAEQTAFARIGIMPKPLGYIEADCLLHSPWVQHLWFSKQIYSSVYYDHLRAIAPKWKVNLGPALPVPEDSYQLAKNVCGVLAYHLGFTRTVDSYAPIYHGERITESDGPIYIYNRDSSCVSAEAGPVLIDGADLTAALDGGLMNIYGRPELFKRFRRVT